MLCVLSEISFYVTNVRDSEDNPHEDSRQHRSFLELDLVEFCKHKPPSKMKNMCSMVSH